MSMDIRTSTDKRRVPNAVIVGLREELGWGRPRLAKEFELAGRRHKITTPEPAAMESRSTDSKRAAPCGPPRCTRSCTASRSVELQ